jgi:hypothetical protein
MCALLQAAEPRHQLQEKHDVDRDTVLRAIDTPCEQGLVLTAPPRHRRQP